MPEDSRLKCTVVSLVPFSIDEEKPGLVPPRFHIDASDGKVPMVLHISRAKHFVYLDDSRGSLAVPDPSDDVARAIVRDFIDSQLGIAENCYPALFWVPGELNPTEVMTQFKVEIEKYKLYQRDWFKAICRIADDDWNRYHQHNVISSFQRVAAEHLGLNPEEHLWMSPPEIVKTSTCPSCGTSVLPTTVVCPSCRCILDKEKHAKLSFA